MDATRPRRRDDIVAAELQGEAVLFDGANGSIHHLNQSAAAVWALCSGEITLTEIVTEIASTFGVATNDVTGDITGVIDAFSAAGLLEGGDPHTSRATATS